MEIASKILSLCKMLSKLIFAALVPALVAKPIVYVYFKAEFLHDRLETN